LLDRGYGKPTEYVEQRVERSNDDDELTEEEIEAELKKRGLSHLLLEE